MVTTTIPPVEPEGARFLFYTNECVGLGHLRRTMNLAEAVTRRDPDASALVITGAGAILNERRHPRIDIVKLPELSRSGLGTLRAARLGLDAGEVRTLRADLALAAARSFGPAVAVVDKTPLGIDDELLPALEALSADQRATLVLGLRDIEDAPDVVSQRWDDHRLRRTVSRLYDAVLVYGPRPAAGEVDAYGLDRLGLPVHHVGYIGSAVPASGPQDLPSGYLLVTAGGGADGFAMFDAVLGFLSRRDPGVPVVLVTGPLMPAPQRRDVRRRGEALGAIVCDFRTDMPAVIAGARAVVAMAGYNTVSEVMRAGKPTLLVPRTGPSREQLVRATALRDSGAAEMLDLDRAGARSVTDHIVRLLTRPPASAGAVAHDGADRAAAILCGLATGGDREEVRACGAAGVVLASR